MSVSTLFVAETPVDALTLDAVKPTESSARPTEGRDLIRRPFPYSFGAKEFGLLRSRDQFVKPRATSCRIRIARWSEARTFDHTKDRRRRRKRQVRWKADATIQHLREQRQNYPQCEAGSNRDWKDDKTVLETTAQLEEQPYREPRCRQR